MIKTSNFQLVSGFDAQNRHLPASMTGSFVLAATLTTLPLAALAGLTDLIKDTYLQYGIFWTGFTAGLAGSFWYVNKMLGKNIQNIATQLHPLYRADLKGVKFTAILLIAAGINFNSSVFSYYFLNPSASSYSFVAAALCAYIAYIRLRGSLYRNHWSPPVRPRTPRQPNDKKDDHQP
jgi:hypothetical protein